MRALLANFLKSRGITRKELALVTGSALFFSLLAISPSIIAWLKTPPGYVFVGNCSYFDPWDINYYFSIINWGKLGHWLWEQRYYTGSSQPHFIFLLLIFLGHLARWFNLTPSLIYHLTALFFSFCLLIEFYFFAAFFLRGRLARLVAFGLVSFGGGWGWLSSTWELAVPDATTFSTLHVPHFAADQFFFLALLGGSYLVLTATKKTKWLALTQFLLLPCFSVLLTLIHPYMTVAAVAIVGVFGVFLAWREKNLSRFWSLFPMMLVSALAVVGAYWDLVSDPLLKNQFISPQNRISTPSFPYIFLMYGALSGLVVFGLWSRNHPSRRGSMFLMAWLIIQLAFLYSPLKPQRASLKGFYMILALWGAVGFSWLMIQGARWARATAFWLLLGLFFSQPVLLAANYFQVTKDNPWAYVTNAEYSALGWLAKNSYPGTVIFSSWTFGNLVPVYTSGTTYFGGLGDHASSLRQEVTRFYSVEISEKERLEFLKSAKVNFLVVGPREKLIGGYQPTPSATLKLVYDREAIRIYEVSATRS
ncbi:MAG: hypothetical protein Q8N84_04450 [bacterium]|nr:hypothetical protein [bacterium]